MYKNILFIITIMSEEAPPSLTPEEIRSFQRITGGDDLLKAIRAQGAKLPATTESIVYQLERLNNLIEKRVAKPVGNYYNSGTRTITTATEESGMKVPPPEDNYPEREKIYDAEHRRADISVSCGGEGAVFVLYRTTESVESWSAVEQRVRPNEVYRFIDVYELALRTDRANTTYTATEHEFRPSEITIGKEIVGRGQRKWRTLYDEDVTRRTCDVVSQYTTPSGYKLHLGGGYVSCNSASWQLVMLVVSSPGLLGNFWYYGRGDLILTTLTSTIIEEGDSLNLYVYNYDYVTRRISVSLTGVLQKLD